MPRNTSIRREPIRKDWDKSRAISCDCTDNYSSKIDILQDRVLSSCSCSVQRKPPPAQGGSACPRDDVKKVARKRAFILNNALGTTRSTSICAIAALRRQRKPPRKTPRRSVRS